MNIAEVNAAGPLGFEDIAEHSPWVAQAAFKYAPFACRDEMIEKFSAAVMQADHPMQLALLRAHPDLATKAKLTADSQDEQRGAGLNALSAQEFVHFTQLNNAYKTKNNFPFIFAVKGATKHQIMESFERRIHNSTEVELQTALQQVCNIIRFRLEDRVRT